MKLGVFVFLLSLTYVWAKCPNPDTVSPFDLKAYTGGWYEIATSPTSRETFERNCSCTHAQYTPLPSGFIQVNNTCSVNSLNSNCQKAVGRAVVNETNPSKLSVSFGGPFDAPYWIIVASPIVNNQYQYAVVWSCTQIAFTVVEFAWILSRNSIIDNSLYNDLTNQLNKLTGYPIEKLIPTAQRGCEYVCFDP